MTSEFANTRTLVWGAARSGIAAAALLRAAGAEVTLADDAPHDLIAPGIARALGDIDIAAGGELPQPIRHWSTVVVSPGVPSSHPRLQEARESGVPVLSEIEIGARFTDARIVAITGTNGKTTTTVLAAHLLGGEEAGAFAAGNVGRALCEVVQRPEACARQATLVIEVSSYQCEHLERFHPDVAVVLNLRPDHLERHGGMDGYREAKARMGINLRSSDTVLFNADDPEVARVIADWQGRRLPFSLESRPDPGVYFGGDSLIHDDGSLRETLMRRSDLRLPGRHSVANALAAAGVARICGVACADIAARCRTFAGVPHRIELVATERGVDHFNDSKATNLDSLLTALRSFDRPIVLIAGGRAKGEDFAALTEEIGRRVRALVLMGEAAGAMESAWGNAAPVQRADGLEDAVLAARATAQEGDVVLLSPGCASFDMFRDFEDRGDQFREAVLRLLGRGGHCS